MKILHFISATGPSAKLTTLYASTLVDALKPAAEVMLIDGESLPPSQYKKQAQDFNPDILHIHTCWDMPTSQMARWAHISNKPVVLSPHGALEPWITNQRYLQEKLPKLLLYQHQTICNADAIVVAGPMEQQALTNLSWSRAKDIEIDTEETDSTTDTPTGKKSRQPWNDRVCIIKNSITTNDITTEQMASQMMLLYRKVIDTNAGMLMSPEARLAEDGLLRVGISRSERSNTITPEQTEAIARLDDESWRKLFLHAQDEDVLHLVKKAIDEMQLNAPHIVIEDIDRFPQRLPKTWTTQLHHRCRQVAPLGIQALGGTPRRCRGNGFLPDDCQHPARTAKGNAQPAPPDRHLPIVALHGNG